MEVVPVAILCILGAPLLTFKFFVYIYQKSRLISLHCSVGTRAMKQELWLFDPAKWGDLSIPCTTMAEVEDSILLEAFETYPTESITINNINLVVHTCGYCLVNFLIFPLGSGAAVLHV